MINILKKIASALMMMTLILPSMSYSSGWNNDVVAQNYPNIDLKIAYEDIHKMMVENYNKAFEAYSQNGPQEFASKLGFDQNDQKYLVKKLTQAGIPELPKARYEDGKVVLFMGQDSLSLRIVDYHKRLVEINGKEYNFTIAQDLDSSFRQNIVSLKGLLSEEISWQMQILEFFIPSAHADMGGIFKAVGLIALGALGISTLTGVIFGNGDLKERAGTGFQNGVDLLKAPFDFRDEDGNGRSFGDYMGNIGGAIKDSITGKDEHQNNQPVKQ